MLLIIPYTYPKIARTFAISGRFVYHPPNLKEVVIYFQSMQNYSRKEPLKLVLSGCNCQIRPPYWISRAASFSCDPLCNWFEGSPPRATVQLFPALCYSEEKSRKVLINISLKSVQKTTSEYIYYLVAFKKQWRITKKTMCRQSKRKMGLFCRISIWKKILMRQQGLMLWNNGKLKNMLFWVSFFCQKKSVLLLSIILVIYIPSKHKLVSSRK